MFLSGQSERGQDGLALQVGRGPDDFRVSDAAFGRANLPLGHGRHPPLRPAIHSQDTQTSDGSDRRPNRCK